MWPYGSSEPPLGQLAPTYADLLEAHWNALPLRRKLHILLYLAGRLGRTAKSEIAAAMPALAEEARDMLRRGRQGLADAAATLRWAASPKGRYAIAAFIESLATFRAIRDVAPFVVLMMLSMMLRGWDSHTSDAVAATHHASIVEAARRARAHRPPPCYLVDGEVWIDAEGGPFYPGRRGYREIREQMCGF